MFRIHPLFASLLFPALCLPHVMAEDVFFEKDVRPILKAHCFHCHGEAGEKEGGLDLRLQRFMIAGGDSGPAVVAGKSDEGSLLERVRSGEMPPGDDKRLSDEDIATLAAWIESGAKTAREEPETLSDEPIFTEEERNYWAFQPIVRPEVPQRENVERAESFERVRTPVDAFILARQNQFAEDADRERLIRRAYFDLIGLPPTPQQIDAFIADESPTAWETVINELLASPHYGERWGRHWLDVAGYADSEGYTDEDRERRHAWRYRDYVIRAFNDDKPFDVFVQEQLAGDEMVPQPHRNLTEDAVEKLTATGFLRMAPDGTASGGIDKPLAQNQVIADTLQVVGTSLLGLTLNCAQCHDHRYDPIPARDYYRFRAIFEPAFDWKHWRTPAGRQISLYTDADRARSAEIELEAKAVDKERQEKAAYYITRTLEEELAEVPEEKRDALRTAYRTAAKERSEEQKNLLKEYPSVAKISTGSLYLYDRRRDIAASKLDAERRAKLKQYLAETKKATKAEVTEANLAKFNPEAAAELKRLAAAAKEQRDTKAAPDLKRYADKAAAIRKRKPVEGFVRALSERPATIPATFVFYRGDHEQPKAEVPPADLSILPNAAVFETNAEELPTTGRRLAFAKYLTSGRHPLFARVIVNRIWLHHFGRGLVTSPGDFGILGNRPTHPELLDWLATEFVERGWSVKELHRLVMMSTVYRQTALDTAASNSESYVGFPVRRLESEVIRDAVLAICGKLNSKQFGPPIPVMQDSVGRIVIGKENLDGERKPVDKVDMGGEEYRRSVYIQVRRTRPLSMLETFDAPALNPNCEQRSFSTATPQSLLMMNSDFALTFADFFAERLLKDSSGNINQSVEHAWRLAFGLQPTSDEIKSAAAFVESMKPKFQAENPKAKPDELQQESLAVFCQALLSSNRFLYVE